MVWFWFIYDDVCVLKLFPLVCCYGLQGWTWIET